MNMMVTGCRPQKLGGYGQVAQDNVLRVARIAISDMKPAKLISGMALGWDQACALAALELKIPLIAAIPFEGQEKMWPQESQEGYRDLLDCAEKIVNVEDLDGYRIRSVRLGVYHSQKLQRRNEWMIDNSEGRLIAMWDGNPGGTANCLKDARDCARLYRNFFQLLKVQ